MCTKTSLNIGDIFQDYVTDDKRLFARAKVSIWHANWSNGSIVVRFGCTV